MRRSKDTLALHITGAMVFQSTIPVSFGMVFTDWRMSAEYVPAFLQAALALIPSILLGTMIYMKKLTAQALVLAGLWYVVWAILVFPLDIEAWVRRMGWFA